MIEPIDWHKGKLIRESQQWTNTPRQFIIAAVQTAIIAGDVTEEQLIEMVHEAWTYLPPPPPSKEERLKKLGF